MECSETFHEVGGIQESRDALSGVSMMMRTIVTMICAVCRQSNDDGGLFCRHCLAGPSGQAEGGEFRSDNFESLRLQCENLASGRSSPEEFAGVLAGMKKIMEMSLAVSGGLQSAPELMDRTGLKMSLISEGLQAFLQSIEMLSQVNQGTDAQKIVQALIIAEAGAYRLDEGMKSISLFSSSIAGAGNPFQSAWLDAAKKNIDSKKHKEEPSH
jgi:hypothetical protein